MAFEFGSARVFESPDQIAMVSRAFRKQGKPVVLVPLSRGVHAGHRALIRAARRIPGAVVIVSLYDATPADYEALREERVDAVFRYERESLWPKGLRTTVTLADHGMEDPAALSAAATQILTLLHIAGPSDLVLGEKDYELLVGVQRMVTDLHVPVTVHSVPTVRMPDGVAISLRNGQVQPAAREQALVLSAALTAGAYAAESGPQAIVDTCVEVLEAAGMKPEYVELRSLGLDEAPEQGDGRLFVAATIGGVRLIDNVGVPIGIGFKNLEAERG